LARDGEIGAIQAAGRGLYRLLRPVLVLSIVLTIAAALVIGYFKPFGRYAYQSMVFAVSNAALHAFVRSGIFSQFSGVTFLIDRIQPDGARFDRVFLYDNRVVDETVVLSAREGALARSEATSQSPPIIRLFRGIRVAFEPTPEGEGVPAAAGVSILRFDEYRTILGDNQSLLFRPRGEDERELSLEELWQRRFDPPDGVRSSDLIAEFHGRIVRILSIPALPFLGILLGLGQSRGDRLFGITLGVLLLVVYHQILDFGENQVESGVVGPLIGLWLPFAFAAGAVVVCFHLAAERIRRNPLVAVWPFSGQKRRQHVHERR
jgi:lipopolysaccharide export system permease protein